MVEYVVLDNQLISTIYLSHIITTISLKTNQITYPRFGINVVQSPYQRYYITANTRTHCVACKLISI